MRTVKFWTSSEDNALRTCLTKFKNDYQAAKWAANKFGRSVEAVYQRIVVIKSGKEITYRGVKEKANVQVKKVEKGINIPAGFTFDIKPTKAVMYTDHVRLYF